MMYTGPGMFNIGIAMTASLFFGIGGIGMTMIRAMTDLVTVVGEAMHMAIIRTMISIMATTRITNQK